MDALVEAIRSALAPDATPETRAAGAGACRTVLAALDASAGTQLPAPVAPPLPPIGEMVKALRGLPAEQLLDLAIARVRAALPADASVAPVQAIKFMHVPIPGAKP